MPKIITWSFHLPPEQSLLAFQHVHADLHAPILHTHVLYTYIKGGVGSTPGKGSKDTGKGKGKGKGTGKGKGPEGGGFVLSQVSSADPIEIELYSCAVSDRNAIQHMIRNWNMSIQRWLVHVVYRRFPIKAGRSMAVFVVTAFLHGLSPGYYVFFVHLAIFDAVEQAWLSTDLKLPRPFAGAETVITVVRHILTIRIFEYIVVPFDLPKATISDCFQVWSTLGYSGHIAMALMLAASFIWPKKKASKSKSKKGDEKDQRKKVL